MLASKFLLGLLSEVDDFSRRELLGVEGIRTVRYAACLEVAHLDGDAACLEVAHLDGAPCFALSHFDLRGNVGFLIDGDVEFGN